MAFRSAAAPVNLDRIRIASPCPVSWDQMTGDNRVRFCDSCQLNVYNISELSAREAQALLLSTEDRICARIYRRSDGTVLTKDCPVGLRTLRRRLSRKATAVFTALAGLSGAAFGQQSRDGKTSCTPQTKITRKQIAGATAARVFSGTILDPVGGAIPGAAVSIVNTATKALTRLLTDNEGRFEFAAPVDGSYDIEITAPGFKRYRIKKIQVEPEKSLNIDTILELSGESETVGILLGEPALIDRQPGITIFDGDLIRRLPIRK